VKGNDRGNACTNSTILKESETCEKVNKLRRSFPLRHAKTETMGFDSTGRPQSTWKKDSQRQGSSSLLSSYFRSCAPELWSRKESELFGWSRIHNNTRKRCRIFLSDSRSPIGSFFTSQS